MINAIIVIWCAALIAGIVGLGYQLAKHKGSGSSEPFWVRNDPPIGFE